MTGLAVVLGVILLLTIVILLAVHLRAFFDLKETVEIRLSQILSAATQAPREPTAALKPVVVDRCKTCGLVLPLPSEPAQPAAPSSRERLSADKSVPYGYRPSV